MSGAIHSIPLQAVANQYDAEVGQPEDGIIQKTDAVGQNVFKETTAPLTADQLAETNSILNAEEPTFVGLQVIAAAQGNDFEQVTH